MTEGGAFSFVIRLLLGGALISGLLFYAAQALQKSPSPAKEAVTEKIGPTLSTRQSAPRPVAVAPLPPSPVASAGPEGAAQPIAPPAGSAAALPVLGANRVTSSYQAQPAAATPPPPGPPLQVTADDTPSVMVDDTSPEDPTPAAKPVAKKARAGQAGCQFYKSYNAATQSYRGFDGKIHDCRP